MKSPTVKRSISIAEIDFAAGTTVVRTSVNIEDTIWHTLKHIADTEGKTLSQLTTEINNERLARDERNLSSALRTHVVIWLSRRAGVNVEAAR